MSRTDPQFKLRMPPALRSQVEQAAEASLRSLNAELIFRLQQSFEGEVPADASEQVPAPTAFRVLHLLCMRGRQNLSGSNPGGSLQPVLTMHPMPPYAGISGRWDYGAGIRCLEAGLQYLSCGSGFYLRETHARAPSAEVLARYLRQWQADALRPCARAIRAGGLSHGL